MVNENKKDLSNTFILDNDKHEYTNLESVSDNAEFEVVSKKKGKKKSINSVITSDQDKYSTTSINSNKVESLKTSQKLVTSEEKRFYVTNFLYYNFNKINRYIPIKDLELDDDTSDSEYDDDFYDN